MVTLSFWIHTTPKILFSRIPNRFGRLIRATMSHQPKKFITQSWTLHLASRFCWARIPTWTNLDNLWKMEKRSIRKIGFFILKKQNLTTWRLSPKKRKMERKSLSNHLKIWFRTRALSWLILRSLKNGKMKDLILTTTKFTPKSKVLTVTKN